MGLKIGNLIKKATGSVKKVVKKAAKPVTSNPMLKQLAGSALGPAGGAILDVAQGKNIKDAATESLMNNLKGSASGAFGGAGGGFGSMFSGGGDSGGGFGNYASLFGGGGPETVRGELPAEEAASGPGFFDKLSGFFNAKNEVGNQTLPYGIQGANPMQDYQDQYQNYLNQGQQTASNMAADYAKNRLGGLNLGGDSRLGSYLADQDPNFIVPTEYGGTVGGQAQGGGFASGLSKYAPFLETGAQLAGGIGGYFLGAGEREKAEGMLQQAQDQYGNLQAAQQGASAYENNPYIQQSLDKMSQFASTGYTPELQAEIANRDRDITSKAQSDKAAAQESLQRRFGSGASGAEAQAALLGQQESANRRALYRQQDLAQASTNQRQGANDLFNAAGNKAQNQDAISRFNAQNMQNTNVTRAAGVANALGTRANVKMDVGQQKAQLADRLGNAVATASRAYRGMTPKKPGEEDKF